MSTAKRQPSEAMRAVLDAGRTIDVTELAEELLSAFGGSQRFAQRYFREYSSSKKGSIARSKALEGILRLVAQASAKTAKTQTDVGGLTDDELADEALRLIHKRGLPTEGPADATQEDGTTASA